MAVSHGEAKITAKVGISPDGTGKVSAGDCLWELIGILGNGANLHDGVTGEIQHFGQGVSVVLIRAGVNASKFDLGFNGSAMSNEQ